jgi:hypothetical protein
VTNLRKRMLEESQRRNYSQSTARCYIHAVENFEVLPSFARAAWPGSARSIAPRSRTTFARMFGAD